MSKIGGKAFILVGAPGMGKTTFNKNLLSQVHSSRLFIYDPNAEYVDFYPFPLVKFDQFTNDAAKRTKSLIIFEEATIFLSNKGSNIDLKEILVRKRHTENIIVLVFHSLRSVPKYLLDLVNYMVVYKTLDPPDIVERFERPEIMQAYQEIKDSDFLINPNTGHKFSSHKLITLSP